MIRVLLHGCGGRMGQIVTNLIKGDAELILAAGVDGKQPERTDFPVFDQLQKCDVPADVAIDFSNPAALDGLLAYCRQRKLPLVLCTTGLTPEQTALVDAAAKEIPVLQSANMSLGINLLMKLLEENSKLLAESGFDIEIVEKHHNKKIDCPSGTALALAESIERSLNHEYAIRLDRSSAEGERAKKEIGISSVRGGTIVGEHEVIFAGTDEIVTLAHGAYSRTVFGKGALAAAKFLAGRVPGRYSMRDVIDRKDERRDRGF